MKILTNLLFILIILNSLRLQAQNNFSTNILEKKTKKLSTNLMNKNEKTLFDKLNKFRINFHKKPLFFSKKLYQTAKNKNLKILKNKNLKKNISKNFLWTKTFISFGSNYILEFITSLKKKSELSQTFIQEDYKNLAVAINKNKVNNLYYITIILSKKLNKDSFSIKKKDFYNLIEKFYNLKFGFNKKMVLNQLKNFTEKKSLYKTKISAQAITIYQNTYHEKINSYTYDNYIKIIFSNSLNQYQGFHTKIFYFKEKSYASELKYLKSIYESNKNKKSPYFFSRIDQKLKLAYWINENQLIEIRSFDKEGIFIKISEINFPIKFINLYYKDFKLNKYLSKIIFFKILKLFLKESSYANLFDILDHCVFLFENSKLKNKIIINYKNKNYFLYSFFSKKKKLIKQELRNNKELLETWIFKNKNVIEKNITEIEIILKNGEKKIYTMPQT